MDLEQLIPQADRGGRMRSALQKAGWRTPDRPLRKIYLEPTAHCNLRCSTCLRNSWEDKPGAMPLDLYRELLAGLRRTKTLETIAFWGFGEPLTHPDIAEMIRLAKERGLRAEMVTNGLLLDRPTAESLLDTGLDLLVVSLDGASPETHRLVRGEADLEAILANIRTLQAVKKERARRTPEVGIEFVARRSNLTELPKLLALARELDAQFVLVSNFLPYTEAMKGEILYWMSTGRFSRAAVIRTTPPVILPRMDDLSPEVRRLLQSWPRRETRKSVWSGDGRAESFCPFVGRGGVAVAWNGSVSPCVSLLHSYTCYVLGRRKAIERCTFGNIREATLPQIWRGNEYRSFRRRVAAFEFSPCAHCTGCDLSETNREDCIGNPFPTCGDCLWAKGILLCP